MVIHIYNYYSLAYNGLVLEVGIVGVSSPKEK